jgi:hypothetical protein
MLFRIGHRVQSIPFKAFDIRIFVYLIYPCRRVRARLDNHVFRRFRVYLSQPYWPFCERITGFYLWMEYRQVLANLNYR